MSRLSTITRPLWLLLLVAGAAPLLAGCEDDGPIEEIGEEIGDAADEVEDEL
jgi:hypothetical protein